MQNKKNVINNFIGVYDGYIPNEACDHAINLFDKYEKFNKTWTRFTSEKATSDCKKDRQLFCIPEVLTDQEFNIDKLKLLMVNFDIALKNYYLETNILKYTSENVIVDHLKIQKTMPSEGYHVWHVEHNPGRELEKRILAFTIYLNNVEEGGETEFLYQSQRVKPVKGRIVIWPAGFPYVHRGNPPLKETKYIATSWILFK